MTEQRTRSSPLPLRERVARTSKAKSEPGEGALRSTANDPSPALAALGHPLPQGERVEGARASQGLRGCKDGGTKPQRRATPEIARRLRRAMTDAERKLWRALRDRQIDKAKFRRQVPIGPYVADFLCFETRIVVEVDGGQHAESTRDRVRDRWFADNGFRVLRFWNNDVHSNVHGVLDTISEHVRRGAAPSPVLGNNRRTP
jgi:very-short-patch-repair endonuclease